MRPIRPVPVPGLPIEGWWLARWAHDCDPRAGGRPHVATWVHVRHDRGRHGAEAQLERFGAWPAAILRPHREVSVEGLRLLEHVPDLEARAHPGPVMSLVRGVPEWAPGWHLYRERGRAFPVLVTAGGHAYVLGDSSRVPHRTDLGQHVGRLDPEWTGLPPVQLRSPPFPTHIGTSLADVIDLARALTPGHRVHLERTTPHGRWELTAAWHPATPTTTTT